MYMNKLVCLLKNDLSRLSSLRWKWLVLILICIIYTITWKGFIKNYFPIKKNLLIGEQIVGRVSPRIDPEIPSESPWGYDSQFFWALAVDPMLRDTSLRKSIDSPGYRSQRILLPFLTWCVVRDPAYIIYGLWSWICIGFIIGLIAVVKLCRFFQIPSLIPTIFFASNPGVVLAFIHPMSDTMASGLFLMGLAYWLKDQKWFAALFFVLACMTREFMAIYLFFIVLHNVWTNQKINVKTILPLALAVIPVLLWQYVIKLNFGTWATVGSLRNFDWPFAGTIKAVLAQGLLDLDVLGALCLNTLCMVMIYSTFNRSKQFLGFMVLSSALLMCISGEAIMESDWAYTRVSILLIVLSILTLFHQNISQLEKPTS
jgi:hypothetical protein